MGRAGHQAAPPRKHRAREASGFLGPAHACRSNTDYWGLYAGISPKCQRTGDQLWPILQSALHANQLPDLVYIYKVLDPLLN